MRVKSKGEWDLVGVREFESEPESLTLTPLASFPLTTTTFRRVPLRALGMSGIPFHRRLLLLWAVLG